MTFQQFLLNMPDDEVFDVCDTHNIIILMNCSANTITLDNFLKFADCEFIGCKTIQRIIDGKLEARLSAIIQGRE